MMFTGGGELKEGYEAMGMGASRSHGHCPLLGDPSPECFVVKMDSRSIEESLRYCGGSYRECEIYRKRVAGIL